MTVEELLKLDYPGWDAIAKMDDEALGEYLKDITNLEPKPLPFSSQPCVGKEEKDKIEKRAKREQAKSSISLDDFDVDPDPNNPIKSNRGRKKKGKMSSEEMDEEAKKLMKELGL